MRRESAIQNKVSLNFRAAICIVLEQNESAAGLKKRRKKTDSTVATIKKGSLSNVGVFFCLHPNIYFRTKKHNRRKIKIGERNYKENYELL